MIRPESLNGILAAALLVAVSVQSASFTLRNGTLACDGQPMLQGVPAAFTIAKDPSGAGTFLTLKMGAASSLVHSPFGRVTGMTRFTSLFRDEPFWMRPQAGTRLSAVKVETQWLLAETTNQTCVMLVPIFDGPTVFTLSGKADGLVLTGVTADPETIASGGTAVFVMAGTDPYQMCDAGAKAVMNHLGTGKLRREKPLPDFIDNFGWCTWNSFYRDVTPEKVRAGLATFTQGGVEPRFLVLDDGWQDYCEVPKGEQMLRSLNAGKNFNGDLSSTVRIAKDEFKVKQFLVWHAFTGYWSGLDSHALAGYDVRDTVRDFERDVLTLHPNYNTQWWGHAVGVVPPKKIAQFYDDYHRRLRQQGVDGVKVDNQSMIESVAHGLGGRVALTRAYRDALEKSVAKHFDGRLINCMANAMETYYCSPRSTLMRTSIDFWPNKPETHGQHLFCNSLVSVWFGEFMQPDWDMFQSGHPMGAFHAAGRAVSGAPVYVADTLDGHDFNLLRKLVLSDGAILRGDDLGRPTRDCLFADVTRDPVLLKVFNSNRDCAVLGIFNCNYHVNENERRELSGAVAPADAPALKGDQFAAFAQTSGKVWRCGRNDSTPLSLGEGKWEIVSFAPVENGVAVLGLADKFNSTGAVLKKQWHGQNNLTVTLRDGGQFVAWCQHSPKEISAATDMRPFAFDPFTGKLACTVPAGARTQLNLKW